MEISNCPLCNMPSNQTKCLLYSIKRKLKTLLSDYVPDFNEDLSKESKNQLGFVQMLKIVFGDRLFSTKSNSKCSHEKVCRYMKRKFKCDSKTFQQLCDHLAFKIGEKNYHFQVLTSQIKTLGETLLKQFGSEQVSSKDKLRTEETIEREEKEKNRCEKLVENQIKNIQNKLRINQQVNQQINYQLQYCYPFGFYYSPVSSNISQSEQGEPN